MDELDLLVIGGGITGAGVARLAARNGFRVALLDRGDLMSGTSSVSSHMLHGGLRYLEHLRLGLVGESLGERAAVSRMAPALVQPRRFLVPLYRGGRLAPWKLRLGLQLYDWLAGRRGLAPHAMLRPREALALEPDLAPEGLLGAGLYSDVVMDDGRIGIAVARDAADHGAAIHTYTEVTGARPGGATLEVLARDRLGGGERSFHTRTLVVAAGPWADAVRAMLTRSLTPGAPEPPALLRPSRGVHLVYPALTRSHALLLTARADGRVFFVVPFSDRALVGTTEVEVSSPPPADAWRASPEEVRYLRAELRRALPGVAGTAPLAVFAGVRPLVASQAEVGRASREHHVLEQHPIYTVIGGKYTTFRVMARDALAPIARRLRRGDDRLADPEAPLPMPLGAGRAPDAIAEHAVAREFARRLEDVLRRRSALWLAPDRGRVAATVVARVMGEKLGWSEERRREEIQAYESALFEEDALLDRAREDA